MKDKLELGLFDILILHFDTDIWNIEDTQQILEVLQKSFPNNQIVAIPKGMELSVIHKGVI